MYFDPSDWMIFLSVVCFAGKCGDIPWIIIALSFSWILLDSWKALIRILMFWVSSFWVIKGKSKELKPNFGKPWQYVLEEFVAHSLSVNCLKIGRKPSRVLLTGGEDHKVNLWAIGKPNAMLVSFSYLLRLLFNFIFWFIPTLKSKSFQFELKEKLLSIKVELKNLQLICSV